MEGIGTESYPYTNKEFILHKTKVLTSRNFCFQTSKL